MSVTVIVPPAPVKGELLTDHCEGIAKPTVANVPELHVPEVVVSSPPVVVTTHRPEVRPLSVMLDAESPALKVCAVVKVLETSVKAVVDGKSASTLARKLGVPDDPFGEKKPRFADCDCSVMANVPEEVMELGVTASSAEGTVMPMLATDPQGKAVVASKPPVLACTQSPEVNALSVILGAVSAPVIVPPDKFSLAFSAF